MSYADLLRDPRWQRRRLEVMKHAEFRCEACGDDKTTLNVHHVVYVKGRKPWEYEQKDLQCLCEPCHAELTKDIRGAQRLMSMAPPHVRGQALGFLATSVALSTWQSTGGAGGYGGVYLTVAGAIAGARMATGLSWQAIKDSLDADGLFTREAYYDAIEQQEAEAATDALIAEGAPA